MASPIIMSVHYSIHLPIRLERLIYSKEALKQDDDGTHWKYSSSTAGRRFLQYVGPTSCRDAFLLGAADGYSNRAVV